MRRTTSRHKASRICLAKATDTRTYSITRTYSMVGDRHSRTDVSCAATCGRYGEYATPYSKSTMSYTSLPITHSYPYCSSTKHLNYVRGFRNA